MNKPLFVMMAIVFLVFCTFSSPKPVKAQQLIDNGDDTITDPHAGLMWLKKPPNELMTWEKAIQYADNLSFAGYDDWRVPYCEGSNAQSGDFGALAGNNLISSGADPQPFEFSYGEFWTSTEYWSDPSMAMAYNLWDPALNPESKTKTLYVWPVRTIAGGSTPLPVDVWIKDCTKDTGTVPPSRCIAPFESPDIFIDNYCDGKIDFPLYGHVNTIRAIIRNNSDVWVRTVEVTLWRQKPDVGSVFPYTPYDPYQYNPNITKVGTYRIEAMKPHVWEFATFSDTIPSYPPVIDWCYGIVINHADDPPVSPPMDTRQDNNVAAASLSFISSREGQDAFQNWHRTWWGKWYYWVLAGVFVLSISTGYIAGRNRWPPFWR